MKICLQQSPKYLDGFAALFPYNKQHIDQLKQCLGYEWNAKEKCWESQGPEVLLDMQRFGIEITDLTPKARELAETFRKQIWEILDAKSEPILEVPYDYQRQGTRVLKSSERYLLGDDMGIGKTKQALDAAVELGAANILVLCPKTLTYNWLAEVEKWHPEVEASIVPDSRSDRVNFWESPLPRIIIANYEKVLLADWPSKTSWDVLILDEIQRLKNQTTATYKVVRTVVRRSQYVWGLTGTPLEIRLQELYSIFTLLRPALFGNFMRFRDQHLIWDWAGNVVGSRNLELLRDRLGYFMLRRTKQEVLANLPPKVYNNQFIKLSMLEQKEYQQLLMDFDSFLQEHEMGGSDSAITQLIRMRQYCCSPQLLDIERHGSKYEALVELIEDWNGSVLIFCFFEKMTALLAQWLKKDVGFNPLAYISGPVAARDRIQRAKDFNDGKLGRIFLSTDAGQQGINLTGADLVIHYDQLWNPQKMHQREDRAHRIGQQGTVNVTNLLCMDTIDAGMYQLNLERQELFDSVIEGAEEAMLRKLDSPRLRRIAEGRLSRVGND